MYLDSNPIFIQFSYSRRGHQDILRGSDCRDYEGEGTFGPIRFLCHIIYNIITHNKTNQIDISSGYEVTAITV